MDSQEFREIYEYLDGGSYPESINRSAQHLWNFKRKVANYSLPKIDPGRLYKVSVNKLIPLLGTYYVL